MASSSDGVKNNINVDHVAIAREQAQAREQDIVRRHKEQLKEQETFHKKEIDSIKANYDEKIKSVRENSKHHLAEKEAEHVKQIQQLQALARAKKSE